MSLQHAGCRDIEIRKIGFVTNAQFLWLIEGALLVVTDIAFIRGNLDV